MSLCACGCGQETPLASHTRRGKGHVKGEPVLFCRGHRASPPFDEMYVVDGETGCWNWLGSRMSTRRYGPTYGKFKRLGRHFLAHRVAYETFVGPIPDGLEIDHLCRNHACVNPAHMEPVTHAENMRRRFAWERRMKVVVE